jgi:hypothetical protein
LVQSDGLNASKPTPRFLSNLIGRIGHVATYREHYFMIRSPHRTSGRSFIF